MKKSLGLFLLTILVSQLAFSQKPKMGTGPKQPSKTTADNGVQYVTDSAALNDTLPTVSLQQVDVLYFKTPAEWMQYYKYKSRIEAVLPYVKIAKQLYNELMAEKQTAKKRDYKRYRKDVEKEMRDKFERDLKDLTVGQGEMLFKLINRETGNNSYTIIKEIKGGATAWFYQVLAKHWGYDLKDKYDPQEEKMIELIIHQMGPAYNV